MQPELQERSPDKPCRVNSLILDNRIHAFQSSTKDNPSQRQPRTCPWLLGLSKGAGPPPRVRGQCSNALSLRRRVRSTPARAGTIGESPKLIALVAVHPRACGDNVGVGLRPDRPAGPPPRVRGQYVGEARTGRSDRSTPARAGTMSVASGWAGASGGPPPRVRGQCIERTPLIRQIRSTPARAGTMPGHRPPRCTAAVHPRACGDNIACALRKAITYGPPPRARGQCSPIRLVPIWGRSTPARAGTILASAGTTRHLSVHPRACGDNSQSMLAHPCRAC